jgi:hypothetical protein
MTGLHTSQFFYSEKTPGNLPGLFFKHPAILTAAVVLFFCLVSCTTLPERVETTHYTVGQMVPEKIVWRTVTPAIERVDFFSRELPLRWHAVRIDLSDNNLQIITFPSKTTAEQALRTGITVGDFSRSTKAVAAINVSPFTLSYGFLYARPAILGLWVVGETLLSEPEPRYGALLINKTDRGTYTAEITDCQTKNTAATYYAFGGYWTILRGNTIFQFKHYRTARTAAGISENGKILILLSVEGKKRESSQGLSFMECAQILKTLGAETALEFDGGSSSALYINGGNTFAYETNRKVAACLGFR